MSKQTTLFVLCSILLVGALAEAAFEEVGGSARSMGMGAAFVATADDGDALRYNAAGLAQVDRIRLRFTQSRPFAGLVVENFLTGVLPLGKVGSLGIGVGQLQEDNRIYRERVLHLAFARRWGTHLATGIQIKQLRRGLDAEVPEVRDNPYLNGMTSASALSLDLGLLVSGLSGFSAGVSLGNLLPADVGFVEEESLPLQIRFGAAYAFAEIAAKAQQPALRDILKATQVAFQLDLTDDGRSLHVGFESWVGQEVALRAGYLSRSGVHSAAQLTVGASLRLKRHLQLDYAFQWLTADLAENTGHRVSTSLVF